MVNPQSRHPLLVFADDWGRHPSSCQYLVKQLLGRYEVYWVNTIGMRKPRLNWATMTRAFGKLSSWVRPKKKQALPEHLHVASPRMWPWFSKKVDRRLNRWLLTRQLGKLISRMPELPTAITTIPIVSELIGVLPVRRWVYYCVDDFGQWPGLDQKPLREMEERLVLKADVTLAVSENLQDRISQMGGSSHLLTHGVDLAFWSTKEADAFPEVAELERPLVVFWGLLDQRMDVSFVKALSTAMTSGTIVLAGPTADPDPALWALPRVAAIGNVLLERLPTLAREAQVLVMPYADLPVTRAMQPLKLKEYLATGKPTVVRTLPAIEPWSDCLDMAATPDEFVRAVLQRLAVGISPEQVRARERLAHESWAAKANLFEQWALKP